jgi:hypothetical protein
MAILTKKRSPAGTRPGNRTGITDARPEDIPGMAEMLARMQARPMVVGFTPQAVAILRGLAQPPLAEAAE